MTMRTQALAPFGVAITGFAIATASARDAEPLLELIARGRVAVFRDQEIDDAAFLRFLRLFGALTFTDGETPVDGAPSLNVVSNVGRTTPPRSVFHTDTSYVARPPALTALHPVLLPRAGGSTVFSDQVRAAATLSDRVRRALDGRTVLHGATGVAGGATRHPLFRRHPRTGEIALYLSTPERCTAMSGVDDATSARAIAALYRHSIRETQLYRHEWRAGDVLVWDDRLTMHRADHTDVVGDRVLHRGMVGGEIPVPA
jgi:taurine dioxygenase